MSEVHSITLKKIITPLYFSFRLVVLRFRENLSTHISDKHRVSILREQIQSEQVFGVLLQEEVGRVVDAPLDSVRIYHEKWRGWKSNAPQLRLLFDVCKNIYF